MAERRSPRPPGGPFSTSLSFLWGPSRGLLDVQATCVAVAAVVAGIALLTARTPMPFIRKESAAGDTVPARPPAQQRQLRFAVVAQFSCVAAQVGIGTFLIDFVTEQVAGIGSRNASPLLSVAMVCLLVERFLGTAPMSRIAPPALLAVHAAINVLLCLLVAAGLGGVSVTAPVATFFFMSIRLPTIFALGVKDPGPRAKGGASFIICPSPEAR